MDLSSFGALIADQHGLVVVSTARADGSIQSSVVNAGVMTHPVTGVDVVAAVVAGPVKLAHLRARPWATLTGVSGWRWGTVEGDAELAGPDDPLRGVPDAVIPGLLRDIFTAAGGTHDDWEEFDRAMADERRAALFVVPGRVYGVA